jgi:hypothetical protein
MIGGGMRPRYRRAKDPTRDQRQRAEKVLIGPLLLRSFLPSLAVCWAFIAIEMAIAKTAIPDIDLNGGPFILIAYPIACLAFVVAMAVTHFMFVRWLLRYRTERRGRVVALRDVLRPTDDQPSRLRRVRLAL